MSINKSFSREKFVATLKYSLLVELIFGIIVFLIWLIFNLDRPTKFPLAAFTLGTGGIFLTSAGCVGPGRYKKPFDLVIYSPIDGSTFSEEIPVSGFTVDETISHAKIIVNHIEIGILNFVDALGNTSIPRDAFLDQTINAIWLESDNKKSNKSYFTLFDYSDELSDEEIDEFIKIEEEEGKLDIVSAKNEYLKKRFAHVGSVSWALFTMSLMLFTFGSLFDILRTM